jgi:DNA-binding transcriptional LysR family regulator
VDIDLETGPALRLIEELRADRLDAVVIALPAPTSGLRTMLIGEQRAVAVLPAGHRDARSAAVDFERLAPERVIILPREANPAFHNAVVAMCRTAGLAPTLVETSEPRVEHALLLVATGAGMALVPESAAERYAAPGIRFVPLVGAEPAFQTAVVTRPDTDSLPTLSFLRAVSRAARVGRVDTPPPPIVVAA